MTILDAKECFIQTRPWSLIDMVRPGTNRSWFLNETLEQIQKRYPGAVQITYEAYVMQKAADQDVPVEWLPITPEKYEEMLDVLPPIYGPQGFQCSEPVDHHARTGQPRFASFRRIHGKYYTSSRAMTVHEFRTGTKTC